jgi:HEPN domain-containing protein
MPEAGGRLWISQADSDLWAAERLFDAREPRSHCQVIAKCQQAVEKSVKAVAAALRDRFIVNVSIGYGHEVDRMASALRRRAKPGDPANVQHYVNRMLSEHTIAEIQSLEALIPRRPPHGDDIGLADSS